MNTSFRNIVTALALSLPIAIHGTSAALADSTGFTIQNESSLTITYLFVSASGQETWGDDVLGEGVLEPGESANVYFESSDYCLYDIRAVAENGAELDDRQVNFCESDVYT
ncbi:MAG TPA: hypothetical protein V6C65_20555, partial [Allocoleopsis sp.]